MVCVHQKEEGNGCMQASSLECTVTRTKLVSVRGEKKKSRGRRRRRREEEKGEDGMHVGDMCVFFLNSIGSFVWALQSKRKVTNYNKKEKKRKTTQA